MTRISERPMTVISRVLASVSFILLLATLSAPMVVAQGADADLDPHPLRPADTSSPRATLSSFLTNIGVVIEGFRGDPGEISTRTYRAYYRALQTFDFSATPDGNSSTVRTQRLLFLKEILDRIELPADNEIPGADEVADGSVTGWTIPHTRIRIRRIEDGPRAGEFLFSADSVQRLDRLYRQAKQLPYKPGASSVGVYEAYLASANTDFVRERLLRNRLRPVDKSSPRSTLEGFLDSVNRAYALVMDAEAKLKAQPPAITRDDAREIERKAANLMQRATATLDLSQVPEALREDVGLETALQLKEILDRMTLPPLESIPNAQVVMAAREKASTLSSQASGPIHWRYPNTAIEIVEITEGERQGQYLFSAGSVERIGDYYAAVRDLPYRRDSYGTLDEQYLSPGKSEGFYQFYASTPGRLIPSAVSWGRWVEDSPDWFKEIYAGQTVWQWTAFALFVLFAALASYFVFRVVRRLAGRAHAPLNEWLRVLVPIILAFVVHASVRFIEDDLNLTGSVLAAVTTGGQAIVFALAAWVVYALFKAVAETIIATPHVPEEGIDASLLRLAARLIGFLMGAWVLIEGLQELGVHMVPLLAGLGVGGLAFALAARPTLENIIGSFMIFADKPYKVGQRVNVMGHVGNVESIGLRSTKIRLLNGHLTTIPNEKMASQDIENIGQRPYVRRTSNITITYDTPPDKINRAVEIVREILAVPDTPDKATAESTGGSADPAAVGDEKRQSHPNEAINQPNFPPRVFFNDFNPDSLNILMVYWYHPPEYWDYVKHAHWINVQIMERFKAECIDFAFPTQTLHLAGDDKRPLTVGQRWVAEEEDVSQGAMLAHAAALGAQTVLTKQAPAGESARPEPVQPDAGGKPATSVGEDLSPGNAGS